MKVRRHWIAAAVGVVAVIATGCPTVAVKHSAGSQRIVVETTGRRVWSISDTVPAPGYKVGLTAEGKVASVVGTFAFGDEGAQRRVEVSLNGIGDSLLGPITVTDIATGKGVTGLVNAKPPSLNSDGIGTIDVTAGGAQIHDWEATASSIRFQLVISPDTAPTTAPATTTPTTGPTIPTTEPVDPPLNETIAIDPTAMAPAEVGTAFETQLSAQVVSGPDVNWSYLSELPPGLEMDPSGLITGTPTAAGTYTFTATVVNATGRGEHPFTITVAERDGILPATEPDGNGLISHGVEVAPGSPVETTFELTEPGSAQIEVCAGEQTPATITLYAPDGTLLGTSLPSADAGCAEIDALIHPEHAFAANLLADIYRVVLSYVPLGAPAFRAMAVGSPVAQILTMVIGLVRTAVATVAPIVESIRSAAVQVSSGDIHTCALLNAGTVSCWGSDDNGQLGDGIENTRTSTPRAVVGLSGVTQISAGEYHTCAVLNAGTVSCWGSSRGGRIPGVGNAAVVVPTPQPVVGLSGVTQVSAGRIHTCALLNAGTVSCWGSDDNGQLGDGTVGDPVSVATPQPVVGLSGVTQISAGEYHTCAVLNTGTVSCWGSDDNGQLGDGTVGDPVSVATPQPVVGLSGVTQISAGKYHTCAVLNTGTVSCWGSNETMQLGGGPVEDPVSVATPQPVVGLSGASQVSAGTVHTCAVLNTGTVWCWGSDQYEQLGNGWGIFLEWSPHEVEGGLSGVTQVSAGRLHTCAVSNTGTVSCWGSDDSGQLGDGTVGLPSGSGIPQPVVGFGSTIPLGPKPWCAEDGKPESGSAYDYFLHARGQLGSYVKEVYNETKLGITEPLGKDTLALFTDRIVNGINPALAAGKAALTGALDLAIGEIPYFGPLYGVTVGPVRAYREAKALKDTVVTLGLDADKMVSQLNGMFEPPPVDSDGNNPALEAIASKYFNKFVVTQGRCPNLDSFDPSRQDNKDRARFKMMVYQDLIPGVADFTYHVWFGDPVKFMGAIKRNITQSVNWNFALLRRLYLGTQAGIRMGERFGGGVGAWTGLYVGRDVYETPGSDTLRQLTGEDIGGIKWTVATTNYAISAGFSQLLKSPSVSKTDWPSALRQLISKGGTGLNPDSWSGDFSITFTAAEYPTAADRVVVVASPDFVSTSYTPASSDRPVPYFYVLGAGWPIGRPDLVRELTDPSYEYPIVRGG